MPRALKLVVIVEALEDAEQFLGIVRIEPAPLSRMKITVSALPLGIQPISTQPDDIIGEK